MCLETPFHSKEEKQTAESQQIPAAHICFLNAKQNTFEVFFQKYKSTEKTPGNIEAPTKQNEQDQIDTAAAHIEI